MFRAPVLVHWLGLGLGWAWIKLSPVDKFDKLNLDEAWLGLAWLGLRLYCAAPYRFLVSMFRAPVLVLAWLGLGPDCLLPINLTN